MRAFLSRTPAIEAWLTRFDGWWLARSPRERVMLGVLAALLLAAVLIFGVIKPLQAARADALADIRTYETYNARLRAAGTLSAGRPSRTGPPAAMVSASAIAAGLTAQVEATPDGARATVADGSYDAVMGWLADLGATTPLAVRRVSIQRRAEPGHVSATVDFGS
jgi:general secretion pathway protein M